MTFAVAAYNAGEAAVDKWVSTRQKLEDVPFFIEFIPYAETKNYVQKVLRNYYNIKWIYR
jgi:soluble lytic murein transglycosylase-like protein